MPWVRIDDQFYNHPKLASLGYPMLACVGLHVLALCYCNAYLTDGFIPEDQIPRLAGDLTKLLPEGKPWGLVERLVKAGLWEGIEGGYRIHDFLDYNPSKKQITQLREIKRKSGQAGGQASAQARAQAEFKQAVKKNSTESQLPSPSPSPKDNNLSIVSPLCKLDGFDIFWTAYPKKEGKGKCEDWWRKTKPSRSLLDRMLATIEKFKTSSKWRDDNGKYVPMPATWLNQRRWEDELAPGKDAWKYE